MYKSLRRNRRNHNTLSGGADVSDAVDSTESYNQSLLNLQNSKNKKSHNILGRLMGVGWGSVFRRRAKAADVNSLDKAISALSKTQGSLSDDERQVLIDNMIKLLEEGGDKAAVSTIHDYVEAGSSKINRLLRSGEGGSGLDDFLRDINNLNNYKGMSYRAVFISLAGKEKLEKGIGDIFIDNGVQSASINPVNASGWMTDDFVKQSKSKREMPAVFIFDEFVSQKNMSSAFLADHVVVRPGTPLELLAVKNANGVTYAYFTSPSKIPKNTYRLYDGVKTKFA
ncbi:hypothetical protein I5Q16_23020 [Serratia marcescens]|nr:hypothetical protein [Serratia marcescens]